MPWKSSKVIGGKERPRHYDMCELIIGYFKVQDDVDSHGRFRSKFKVLFTKRQFLYDFPVSRCNQVDLNNTPIWEQMARIIVPFKTVISMDFNNRRINIQVNASPTMYLGRIEARSGIISNATVYNTAISENSLWGESINSSLLHKITLRKRQADKLKTHLCLFDERFLTLANVHTNLDQAKIVSASPFIEDLVTLNLKQASKSRKLPIRRLPQWESSVSEDVQNVNTNESVFESNQVCSCRVSCRSVRCSCAKAAKSCRAGGSVCLCTNCDNPLNVLESLGLNLEFSLQDRCLFQNIYPIPKLLNFLQKDIKLSCCSTIARVMDCIPGTVLCPNMDCNALLEFSWCRGIVCYPERNPRNHCSYCGQCCFSNKRHCRPCNRCYVVSSKCQECPSCQSKRLSAPSLYREPVQQNYRVTPISNSTFEQISKSNTKPEIIILDGSISSKVEDTSEKNNRKEEEILNRALDSKTGIEAMGGLF